MVSVTGSAQNDQEEEKFCLLHSISVYTLSKFCMVPFLDPLLLTSPFPATRYIGSIPQTYLIHHFELSNMKPLIFPCFLLFNSQENLPFLTLWGLTLHSFDWKIKQRIISGCQLQYLSLASHSSLNGSSNSWQSSWIFMHLSSLSWFIFNSLAALFIPLIPNLSFWISLAWPQRKNHGHNT